MTGHPSGQRYPSSPAALFDLLTRRFGFGTYDDIGNPDPPWWRVRINEAAKLKAMLRKRHATVEQVAVAADYAAARGLPIRYYSELFALITEAMAARRRTGTDAGHAEVRAQVEARVAELLDRGDAALADRLLRCDEGEALRLLAVLDGLDGPDG